MLHFFVVGHGGPPEIKTITTRMAQQCRMLGADRVSSSQFYPAEEEVSRLFYLGFYKDT
jgi:hypothetical protein